MSATAMYPLYMKSGGKLDVGLNFISDKAGAFKTTDVLLAVDYNKIAELKAFCDTNQARMDFWNKELVKEYKHPAVKTYKAEADKAKAEGVK